MRALLGMPRVIQSSSITPVKYHLYPLTSLRFFAALCVFVLHAANHGLIETNILSKFDLSKAVCFFFVLSGFVMEFAYHNRTYSRIKFYLARFARFWPATVTSTFFVISILPRSLYLPEQTGDLPSGLILLVNLLCLHSLLPIPSIFFSFNAVTWSISAEAFFYFVFPWINRFSLDRMVRVVLVFVAISLLLAAVVSYLPIPSYDLNSYNAPVWEGFVYINPLFRLPEFLIGVLAARVFLSHVFRQFCEFAKSASQNFPLVSSLVEVVFLLIPLSLGFSFFVDTGSPQISLAASQITSGCAFSIVILICSLSTSYLQKVLSFPIFVFLGEVSFGFYLYHQPVMIRSAQFGGIDIFGIQIMPNNLLSLFTWSIFLAASSYFLVEKPIQYFLLNFRRN